MTYIGKIANEKHVAEMCCVWFWKRFYIARLRVETQQNVDEFIYIMSNVKALRDELFFFLFILIKLFTTSHSHLYISCVCMFWYFLKNYSESLRTYEWVCWAFFSHFLNSKTFKHDYIERNSFYIWALNLIFHLLGKWPWEFWSERIATENQLIVKEYLCIILVNASMCVLIISKPYSRNLCILRRYGK